MQDPILPLTSIDSVCPEEPLLNSKYLDEENHLPTRMAIDLLEAVRRGIQPCTATADWFEGALTQWVTGESLEAAFGLTRDIRKPLKQKLQSCHLRAAMSWVDPDIVGTKARAEALADEIERFDKNYSDDMPATPLPEWSRIRRCIWRARQFGSLPITWSNLAKRCR